MELPKLFDEEVPFEQDDPVVQWMTFIDGQSKGVLEVPTQKNKDIKNAYDLLRIISQDEKARMIYEARQKEIHDQLTRIKSAKDEGRAEGREEGREEGRVEGREEGRAEGMAEVAQKLLKMDMNIEKIVEITGLTPSEIAKIKK